MHKEPSKSSKEYAKEYLEHEGKESASVEREERKEDPKQESEEQKAMGKATHLQHPQLKGPKSQLMLNDLAYHLHHPQFGYEGPNFPSDKKPKC